MKVVYTIINQVSTADGELWFKVILDEYDYLLIKSNEKARLKTALRIDMDYYDDFSENFFAKREEPPVILKFDIQKDLKYVPKDDEKVLADYWETPEYYIKKCDVATKSLKEVLDELIIPIKTELTELKQRYESNERPRSVYNKEWILDY